MTRVGFLGAMNRDLVAQQHCATVLNALRIDALPLVETPISDEDAQRGAELLQELGAADYLGGSAFNAARVAALLNNGNEIDLAFFGVAGTLGPSRPHLEALNGWGFDTSGVETSAIPPATCLAIVEQAGRTLLTAHGANAAIANWLERQHSALAIAIARCDAIHVTSFLDPASPALIARILERARIDNPELIVSLDPGMAWIAPGGDGFARLLAQTNILHLNSDEFTRLLGKASPAEIGAGLQPGWLLVARTHEAVTLYSEKGSVPYAPELQDMVVMDATGAGDTFCGAFLWSYCQDVTRPQRAVALGFALARHKVGMDGPLALTDTTRREIVTKIVKAEW